MWYPHTSAVIIHTVHAHYYSKNIHLMTAYTPTRCSICCVLYVLTESSRYTVLYKTPFLLYQQQPCIQLLINIHTRFAFCLLYPYSVLLNPSLPIQFHAICTYMYACPPSPLSVPLTLCMMTSTQLGEGGRCCSGWDTTQTGWDTTPRAGTRLVGWAKRKQNYVW